MIISKQNLLVVDVIKPDKNLPILDNVYIGKDGTTVAGNGKAFIAVSPVSGEVRTKLKALIKDTEVVEDIVVTSETVKEVIKNIPRDRQFAGALEHVDIQTGDGVGDGVKFYLHDGKRQRSIDGKVYPYEYAPFRKIFARARKNQVAVRYVLNAKRLLPLLNTLCNVINDPSDFSPLFVEFSTDGDVIFRGKNPITGQRAAGIVWAYKGNESQWLELDEWENSLAETITDDNSSKISKEASNGTRVETDSDMASGSSVSLDTRSPAVGTSRPGRRKAKRRGDRQLSRIIPGSKCPECGEFHLASDGKSEWCSGRTCTYYGRL